MKIRLFTVVLLVLAPTLAFAAIEVEGISLGASKAEVAKLPNAASKGDGILITKDADSEVEVSFDAKGKAKRIYASFRKGLAPMKDLTEKYGQPVKRQDGNSIKYVFSAGKEGTVTLEKVKGYPGYYIEAAR